MPTYRYEARRPDGEKGEGVVEAVSPEAAVAQIRRSYDVVLSLWEIPARRAFSPTARAVASPTWTPLPHWYS